MLAGRYRLLRTIDPAEDAAANSHALWLGRDLDLDRPVALRRGGDPREAGGAARLAHPHAIALYDAVVDAAGATWLVTEYFPSRTMAEVLPETGALSPFEVAQLGAQIADALRAAAAAGVAHPDITPANLLVGTPAQPSSVGIIKLTGFGTDTPATPDAALPDQVRRLGAVLTTLVDGTPHDRATQAGPLTDILDLMAAADPGDRPTLPQVAQALAEAALGPAGRVRSLIGRPIYGSDGGIVWWARRDPGMSSGPLAFTTTGASAPNSTILAATDELARTAPELATDENSWPQWRRRIVANAPTLITAMTASLVIIVLIVIAVILTQP